MADGQYKAKLQDVRANAARLYKAAPEPMKAFQSLVNATLKDGALSVRHKELVALAIAIATRCEGCIVHHVDAARRHGATREEVAETIAVAVEMGGGPATVYGATALAAFDEFAA
ncbi:carboxymuconolactone decarboxylase family protein [Bradyrhizobium elkanii]|uniref:carboxymuconolactone decarboxylase family protein n=1 Tax=Bradyrhizobium elkanii TaxID=29448 RepID=UPI0008414933|nr:carboxymuconolactone decarboxylase family protein [Bradyrhizobium elkanii]ODM76794.1 alkylhydroperoxidase [Bradyrhizobium elkanii]ODM80876.1 alkylhydroperoxidase [Bradyrhizobium elkanii]